ncbi:hypothetical protein E2562_033265 [Oryza meyeriana var. granulata]|uniref:DUF834 domain-containing protein n=1 Tax=Oryza meyeriana var. granulata TaxID=110450 RepID=A0A6G1CUH7_9ORYZ|nr:hypothetical protein E2562_033265 [Oryza meyeriana var. granulata]
MKLRRVDLSCVDLKPDRGGARIGNGDGGRRTDDGNEDRRRIGKASMGDRDGAGCERRRGRREAGRWDRTVLEAVASATRLGKATDGGEAMQGGGGVDPDGGGG